MCRISKLTVQEFIQNYTVTTESIRVVKNFDVLYEGKVSDLDKLTGEERDTILSQKICIISSGDRFLILSCDWRD